VAKSRSKQKPKPKGKAPETASFALSPMWLTIETLLVPGGMLLVLFVLLARFADFHEATAQIVIVAVFVAIRLPLLVYTLARDPRITIGKERMHVPIVSVFQVKPWNLDLDEVASIEERKPTGGAAKLVILRRGGRPLKFASSIVKDRPGLMKAIERRSQAE
jgi:hypothetical protein